MVVTILATVATLSLPSRALPEESAPLRAMTYNIRLDTAFDGANAWPHRRAWVVAQIEWLRPDLFGLQEVVPGQRADLIGDLPRYRFFGEGRDAQGAGEASPLAFDPERLQLIEGGMFWLSPTPEVSSKGWDAANPRIVTWARLRLRESPQVLLAINTHWDHVGLVARRQSATQMLQWIAANARRCERVVVLGDFNSEMVSEQMRRLTHGSPPLRDARAITRSAPFGPAGTFNAFGVQPTKRAAIDHVLVGEGVDVERYAVFVQVIDGRVPSDHFPVVADLRLAPCS